MRSRVPELNTGSAVEPPRVVDALSTLHCLAPIDQATVQLHHVTAFPDGSESREVGGRDEQACEDGEVEPTRERTQGVHAFDGRNHAILLLYSQQARIVVAEPVHPADARLQQRQHIVAARVKLLAPVFDLEKVTDGGTPASFRERLTRVSEHAVELLAGGIA
jgi:hypothetical protein